MMQARTCYVLSYRVGRSKVPRELCQEKGSTKGELAANGMLREAMCCPMLAASCSSPERHDRGEMCATM